MARLHTASTGRCDGNGHQLIADTTDISLAAAPAGGNRYDVTQLIPLLQAVPPRAGQARPGRRRPDMVLGDCGCDPRQAPP
ncbi:hypothetical protein [Streptomyces sp. NPDC102409]|uniref:hypothetical protein n=1 Tax=Streptomyces sp. NPDC102409 TaxID=3366172 RepID=UPI003827D5C6